MIRSIKLYTAASLLLIPELALAGAPPPPEPAPGQEQTQVQGQFQVQTAIAKAEANSKSSAESSSTSTSSANNEGVEQSVSFTSPRQAPSVSAPSVFPTATCQSGFSIGGSNSTGGGVLGITFTKKQCELFLLAQNYASIGLTVAACETLNKTRAAKRAFGADKPSCSIPAVEPAPAPAEATCDDCVSRKELTEREKRIVEALLSK